MWVGPSLGWSFYGLVKGSGGIVGLGGDYGVVFRVILGGIWTGIFQNDIWLSIYYEIVFIRLNVAQRVFFV
jgi:hypothetical protein